MVSVIIPNFNHAPYLERRIASVLNQTYTDFEVILLDDCSTDNSADILLSYRNHPKMAHVVLNEQNSGSTFKQWDKGFELAKGDLIWIAESDDWCEATLLENLVKPFESEPDLALSFCQSLLIDEQGRIIYKTTSDNYEKIIDGGVFVKNSMFGDTILVNAGMAVFRKSALKNTDELYKKLKGVGDWMFWVQIAMTGKVYISAKYLNYFYRHNNSVTSKSIVIGQDIMEGNKIFTYIKEQLMPTTQEVEQALKMRINMYFEQSKLYINEGVKQKVLANLKVLHPNAPLLIRTFKNKQFKKKLLALFK